jgi:hypothetical protein
VSQWLTGKRYPSAQALIAIDKLYSTSPRELDDSAQPDRFRADDRVVCALPSSAHSGSRWKQRLFLFRVFARCRGCSPAESYVERRSGRDDMPLTSRTPPDRPFLL